MEFKEFPKPKRVYEKIKDRLGRIDRVKYIFYPVAVLDVELKERQAEDFTEIELLIERLLDSGICHVDEVADIIGITEDQLYKFLSILDGISHVRFDGDRIYLTDLGRLSVKNERKYTLFTSRQKLLCDGVTGNLLPRQFYRLPLVEPSEIANYDFVMPRGFVESDSIEIIKSEPQRFRHNLVDEVEDISRIYGASVRFMPALAFRSAGSLHPTIVVPPSVIMHENFKEADKIFEKAEDLDLEKVAQWLKNDRINCAGRDMKINSAGNIELELRRESFEPEDNYYLLDYVSPGHSKHDRPNYNLIKYGNLGLLLYIWSRDEHILNISSKTQMVFYLNNIYTATGKITGEVLSEAAAAAEGTGYVLAGDDKLSAIADKLNMHHLSAQLESMGL